MRRISFFLFLTSALLLQSCIKEDVPACDSELLLRFRYTLNNQYTNLFGQEVRRITVYLFDSNGKYVEQFTEQGSKLTNEYVMHIPVTAGKYSVVVCGGDFTTYTASEINNSTGVLYPELRKGVSSIYDFRIELKNQVDTDSYLLPTYIPDDLYTGWTSYAVSSVNSEVTDVELMKDTKKVKVKINGVSSFSEPLNVYVTAINGRYRHDNSIDLNQGTFKYTPVSTVTAPDYQEANLKGMRLVLGQSPMLLINKKATSRAAYNAPEVLYSKNILELILATGKYKAQEDIDREDEFIVEITFLNGVVIGISINGWKINNITTDTL